MTPDLVKASGGLVFRPSGDSFEILIVHRPRYDDWSFPKGKNDPGEIAEFAALREVEEETGLRCWIVAPLGEMRYRLSTGQTKAVRYFAMQPSNGPGFRPNAEVDEIRWVLVTEVPSYLTYQRDRDLVAAADLPHLGTEGTAFLVRHGAAGDRRQWSGDDSLRPLSDRGRRQAEALAENLAAKRVDLILSSPTVRCRQTVEPLAAVLGQKVEDHAALAEAARPEDTLSLVESLAGLGVVMSSHGDVIPELVKGLDRSGVELRSPTGMFECRKGSVWTVKSEGGAFTRADYTPPPEV